MASEDQPEVQIEGIPYRSNTLRSEAIDENGQQPDQDIRQPGEHFDQPDENVHQPDEDDLQLDERLREKDVQGEPWRFYPLKAVYRIFTRNRVLAQLKSYGALPNADHYVDLICAGGTEGGKAPPYIKIFAILVLIGKGEAIGDFVDAHLSDETLPFYRYDDLKNAKRQHYLFLKDTNAPISSFKNWAPYQRAAFDTTQRTLLVPYLELGPNNMVKEYGLSDRDVLPWCKSKSDSSGSPNHSMVEGAYGKVYCVDIHRDCHAFTQVLQTVQYSLVIHSEP